MCPAFSTLKSLNASSLLLAVSDNSVYVARDDDEFKNKPDSNKTGKVQWPAHASPELTSTAGVPGMIGSGGKPPQMMSFSPMAPGGVPQSS